MITDFDQEKYRDLLLEIAPKPIETEEDHKRLLAIAEKFTFSNSLTLEEKAICRLLAILIEAYETEEYPMDSSAPHEILVHLMEAKGIGQADFVGVIGSSGVVSEIVNGKRSISKKQAIALGSFFNISPALFLG